MKRLIAVLTALVLLSGLCAAYAETAAAEREESAAANAELILQRAQEDANSFWKDVNELLTKQLNGTASAAISGGLAAEGDGVDGQ